MASLSFFWTQDMPQVCVKWKIFWNKPKWWSISHSCWMIWVFKFFLKGHFVALLCNYVPPWMSGPFLSFPFFEKKKQEIPLEESCRQGATWFEKRFMGRVHPYGQCSVRRVPSWPGTTQSLVVNQRKKNHFCTNVLICKIRAKIK
jgi:hypothetical protein